MRAAPATSWVGAVVAALAIRVAAALATCLVATLVIGLVVAPAQAADPAKVLRIAFPVAETGFDPAKVSDLYSSIVIEAIFERLYTYDYLARPVKIVPRS